jgi:hypothetical protein
MARKSTRSATVHAFPSARHSKMVTFIARDMRARPSLDAAEHCLIEHLEIEWGRLAGIGVDPDEIERQCRDFARAVWKIVLQDRQAWGAA